AEYGSAQRSKLLKPTKTPRSLIKNEVLLLSFWKQAPAAQVLGFLGVGGFKSEFLIQCQQKHLKILLVQRPQRVLVLQNLVLLNRLSTRSWEDKNLDLHFGSSCQSGNVLRGTMGRRYPGAHYRPSSSSEVDSGVDALAVFMASGSTTDAVNRNGPATPPNTLNLRSSHNELLNAEIRHTESKNSTPPKCRKKYALTNIQTAMGLSDPAVQPLLGNGSANIKLVKNGENQLRKAAEQGQQDPNKNLGTTAGVNVTSEKFEGNEPIPQDSSGCEILPSQPRRTKSFLNYYADLETSARDLEQGFVGMEDKSAQSNSQASTVIVNGEVLPRKQNKMPSPEDGQVATVSSSPETKKDHPKTGAKTDCALHRIQNLAPSDEDSSWTTLSQDSASPSSPDE
ncbi:hypothetical protein EK904_011194, partial [Melospiza melodia maxima]